MINIGLAETIKNTEKRRKNHWSFDWCLNESKNRLHQNGMCVSCVGMWIKEEG